MPRLMKEKLNFKAADVFAASCMAQRINGSYLKTIEEGKNTETNRQIVERLLANTSDITPEDYEQGEIVRKFYQSMSFKILQGIRLGEFENAAMVISNRNVIESNYDIAVICSLPSSYVKAAKRNELFQRINNASGGYLGPVGNKISTNLEVLRCIYSNNYNTHFVTGITNNNQAVFFSYREPIEINKLVIVRGTIKAHKENMTQLNRVSVI